MKKVCILLLAILLLRDISCCTGFTQNDLILNGEFDDPLIDANIQQFFLERGQQVPHWNSVAVNSTVTEPIRNVFLNNFRNTVEYSSDNLSQGISLVTIIGITDGPMEYEQFFTTTAGNREIRITYYATNGISSGNVYDSGTQFNVIFNGVVIDTITTTTGI